MERTKIGRVHVSPTASPRRCPMRESSRGGVAAALVQRLHETAHDSPEATRLVATLQFRSHHHPLATGQLAATVKRDVIECVPRPCPRAVDLDRYGRQGRGLRAGRTRG